ncbi:MAG: NAD(P)/FAD-dependent oxidoreductase, partial [Actinomycetota bacterium]|nr:NAD(P)/FAD-dependent oxidoreductase [Actinomycetota bacterium]
LVEGGARRVRLAVRTPPNVFLRDHLGIPSQAAGVLLRHVPARIGDRIMSTAQRFQVGDLSPYGLPPAPRGPVTQALQDDVIPILDVGLIRMVKAGNVEPIAAVESFDRADVVLADGARVQPDAVIACAGYARGLEPLVGHLGLLGAKGRPTVHGAQVHPAAPRLHFIGYTNPISGMFREFGIDARRIARALSREREASVTPTR